MPGERENELLRRVLQRADEAAPTGHIDHERLALFAAGALTSAERNSVVEHLADCTECRRVASSLMNLASVDSDTTQQDPPTIRFPGSGGEQTSRRYAWMALAAALLVAVTLTLNGWRGSAGVAERNAYDNASRLLASSQFSQARKVISNAASEGTHSDRLQSLDAQAAREMPSALALAQAGRLTDFGIDVSGAVGRDVSPTMTTGLATAQDLLAGIKGQDFESLVNRGHVALSAGRVSDALADFDQATTLAPRESLGWLGRGLANYLGDRLAAAAQDFRQAIALSPGSVAAHFNLAITLHEQGRDADALAEWKHVLGLKLSEDERKQAERAIELLQQP